VNIGIIAGESFFKTAAAYIAVHLAQQLQIGDKIFLFNKTQNTIHLSNIAVVNIGNRFQKILQQQRILAMLKKNQIEKIFVFDGNEILKTNLPQILILNADISRNKMISEKINFCSAIIGFSQIQQQKLQQLFPRLQEKIVVAAPMLQNDFAALNDEEKNIAKQQFANEKEYFVCADFFTDQEQFLTLLKAFSAFKKLQQSNWKLVVLWRSFLPEKDKEEMLYPLSNFKFREDVIIVHDFNIQTAAQCIGGAYALINMDTHSVYEPSILEALQCCVPVISPHNPLMNDYAGIIIEPLSSGAEHLAEKMMQLYKDELLRSRFSQKINERIKSFHVEENPQRLEKFLS
jgi:glycosyltransferase involved in cell wall biosynthesis